MVKGYSVKKDQTVTKHSDMLNSKNYTKLVIKILSSYVKLFDNCVILVIKRINKSLLSIINCFELHFDQYSCDKCDAQMGKTGVFFVSEDIA